jgi:hypothetical protein
MRRREFITLVGSAPAWPLAARGQQAAMPVIGFLHLTSLQETREYLPAFHQGIGDGQQSGTSGSPSILNASPEAAAGGGLALLKTGDRVRIDLNQRTVDIVLSVEELDERRRNRGAFPVRRTKRLGRSCTARRSDSTPPARSTSRPSTPTSSRSTETRATRTEGLAL